MADEGVAVDGITGFNPRRYTHSKFFFPVIASKSIAIVAAFSFFCYGWLCQRMLKAIEKKVILVLNLCRCRSPKVL